MLGITAYPDIASVPERVDLAVVVTPAATVPGIIADCVRAGVKGAIVISAGFKETGRDGVALERRILDEARRGRLRLIGPNCLGVMNPHTGLNATFANAMALPGRVAFVSDALQKQGLGSELLRRLVAIGRREGLRRIVGYISAENADMLRMARTAGFQTRRSAHESTLVDAWLDLPAG